MVHSFHPIY